MGLEHKGLRVYGDNQGQAHGMRDSVNYRCYNIMTCDGGKHKRKDRQNGGMYIVKTECTTCLSCATRMDTIIIGARLSRGKDNRKDVR